MKYLVMFLVLVGFVGTSFAEESDYALTSFDIVLSEDDFTTKGPNHNILMLERNQSATINITIQNNDDKLHKITLTNPKYSSNLFDYFVFEPDQIMVPANQQNSTKLYLKIANDTDIHSSFTPILAQSNVFGMKGIGFVIVVDREIDELTDKSLRAGLPGPAFSRMNGDISKHEAEKMIDNGFGTPQSVPDGYSFQGMTDWGQNKQFIYSPVPVDNSTESIAFWEGKGMMINYYNNADRPNINNTKSLPVRIAQDEGQQITINGLMGMAIEKQTRIVAYSNTTYDVPSEVEFFDDVKRSSVSLHANIPLDELLKVASSIPILDETDSTYDGEKSKQSERLDPDPVLELWNNHAEIIDGTIVSKTVYPSMGKGMAEFHVKVNKFFKPLSKDTESVTLFASYEDSDIPGILGEGDRALIYIESGNNISKYSVKVDKSTYCEPRDYMQISPVLPNDPNQLVRGSPTLPFDWKDQCVADYFTKDPNFWMYREYRPPMQQWKVHDIPIEEQRCSGEGEDFVSVQKTGNSVYKYCVKPESVPKLIERGWIDSSGKIFKQKTSHPEPPPTPVTEQCKPGLPPFTSDFYLDKEACKWKSIPEPVVGEAISYVWNAYLQKMQIDFSPKDTSYTNADEGFFPEKENRVCSPLILSNGSEIYISSTFTVEPFEMIDTVMSETQPDDCHKIWKTEPLLVEPSPELGAWLKTYWEKENEN